ncbi:potassium channel subfamily K member 16 [Nephila pilipes]|uniref:Potassium channel subfamily K member 16 n=1 Tax=Nephila pilipes TaxID=299642 RepID=A0A8X6I4L6_NEPPI|nr:potassium channel subfamily K member 16 [Nephila pilipes]
MVEVLRKENLSDKNISETLNQKYFEIVKSNQTKNTTWRKVFGEKFLFSMILITTIGYGNVRPVSSWAKCFSIVYCMLGVPLNITLCSLISLQYRVALRKVVKKSDQLVNSKFIIAMSIVVYFVSFLTLIIFIPAIVFVVSEDWAYNEAIYYCFVTLSTIGFGDYVASIGSRYHSSRYYTLQVILMFIWLLLGVTFVAMSLNLISYLIGLQVLDKLDSKCVQRSIARREISEIYKYTVELNWQLAKRKPKVNILIFELFGGFY